MKDLSLPAEYQGAWCEVKTADNELIAVGRIKTVMPKYIILSDKNQKMPLIQQGTLVKLNVFMPEKEIRVCIGNVYISNESELSFVNIISLVNNEKRNFFRVDTHIKTLALYRASDRDLYPTETEITILDMSLNGIKIRSSVDIAEHTVIGVKLQLKNKKEVMLSCEIVRTIGEKKDGFQKYGCRLMTDENKYNDDLCSYLFDRQREFIKNNAL